MEIRPVNGTTFVPLPKGKWAIVSVKIFGHDPQLHSHSEYDFCDWRCAAAIGALYGIGAETGTQILLISSVGALNDSTTGFVLMAGFLIGMFLCQIVLALLATEGYLRAQNSNGLLCLRHLRLLTITS